LFKVAGSSCYEPSLFVLLAIQLSLTGGFSLPWFKKEDINPAWTAFLCACDLLVVCCECTHLDRWLCRQLAAQFRFWYLAAQAALFVGTSSLTTARHKQLSVGSSFLVCFLILSLDAKPEFRVRSRALLLVCVIVWGASVFYTAASLPQPNQAGTDYSSRMTVLATHTFACAEIVIFSSKYLVLTVETSDLIFADT
jgi:hypothetical protein